MLGRRTTSRGVSPASAAALWPNRSAANPFNCHRANGAAVKITERKREELECEVRLAMQDEMCDGPGDGCRTRMKRAKRCVAAILKLLDQK